MERDIHINIFQVVDFGSPYLDIPRQPLYAVIFFLHHILLQLPGMTAILQRILLYYAR